MELYYNALSKCAERYYYMLDGILAARYEGAGIDFDESDPDAILDDFNCEFITAIGERKPLMKLNRWLGYIQGCLIERGYTTVEAERDFTRPLFQPLDFA